MHAYMIADVTLALLSLYPKAFCFFHTVIPQAGIYSESQMFNWENQWSLDEHQID